MNKDTAMAAKTCIFGLLKPFLQSCSLSKNCCGARNLSSVAGNYLRAHIGPVGLCSHYGNGHVLSQQSSPVYHSYRCKSIQLADSTTSWAMGVCGIEELEDFVPLTDPELQKGVAERVNTSIELGEAGRLFAVVYIRGMQHKVTAGDIIAVRLNFPPNVGDRIRLEKVLAVGGKDFTLFGQPMLSRDVVRVDATVVEKTLSHSRIWRVYQKRKSFQRFHLFRELYTMLVINSIQVGKLPVEAQEQIDEKKII
ncbi:39S ribosomal protein L21 mitochondrial [Biomphalaria glabrata]